MRNTVFVQSTVYNNQIVTKLVQYITLSYGSPWTKTEVTTEVVNIVTIPVYSYSSDLSGLVTI